MRAASAEASDNPSAAFVLSFVCLTRQTLWHHVRHLALSGAAFGSVDQTLDPGLIGKASWLTLARCREAQADPLLVGLAAVLLGTCLTAQPQVIQFPLWCNCMFATNVQSCLTCSLMWLQSCWHCIKVLTAIDYLIVKQCVACLTSLRCNMCSVGHPRYGVP